MVLFLIQDHTWAWGGGTGPPQASNLTCGGAGPPQTDIL